MARPGFLLLIASFAQVCLAASPAEVRFEATPDFLAAGEAFAVAVSYELPAGLTARLNVELKDTAHNVLQAQHREVSGKGTFDASFTAPAQPQAIQVAAWVGTDWQQSLSPIVHTPPIDVVSPALAAKRRAARAEQKAAAEAFLKPLGPLPPDKYAIALLKDERLPNHDPKLADSFVRDLRQGGHEVTIINADQLCNPFLITTDRFDMLFLPACHTLPGEAGPVIKAYCDKGGDLVALGTPAFRNILTKVSGKWLSHDDWRKLLNAQPSAHMLFDFESEDLSKWQRHTNDPNSPITRELVPGKEGKALHVVMPNMTGWDGSASPKLYGKTFPDGYTLTCLWAKAGDVGGGSVPREEKEKTRGTEAPPTGKLMLEWRERDGSRWIATFRVGPDWQRIVLAPGDFTFWQSVPTRGGPGDCFKPENAEQLVLGVAHTHTGPRTGRYEFLIDQLGTAPAPAGLATPEFLSPPILENFSPSYKFYAIAHMDLLLGGAVGVGPSLPLPAIAFANHPRPTAGFATGRSWRWAPLLFAATPCVPHRDLWRAPFDYRGAVAGFYLDFDTRSARLAVGVEDEGWYRAESVRGFLGAATKALADGVWIREGGSECPTHLRGEAVHLGARVINIGRLPRTRFLIQLETWDQPTPNHVRGIQGIQSPVSKSLSLRPGQSDLFECTIPAGSVSDRMCAWLRLFDSSRKAPQSELPVDAVVQGLFTYRPKAEGRRRFVTVRDGDFWLDGKKWYPHGVNYMPSSGIGTEDQDYFEYWLDAKPYDPWIVSKDLKRIKAIGLNSVSIFIYHRSLAANNLLDFLRRCEELGLKVNLSLRPGTPMDYKWEEWKEIIEKNRLWEQDVIWAYDIAWEPFFGTDAERKRYDPLWREWLIKKHGSLDAARKAWGIEEKTRGRDAPPTEITGPDGWQLTHDGEHRKFVADYRRFADQLVERRYLDAYKKIKSIDPNHLISFRMTVTGDPTFNSAHSMPYDFKGVAQATDFLAPEGYGRIGDWEKVKAGLFTVAYARMCAPDKPVFWAEAGVSAWDNDAMAATPEKLDFQARFYRDFYRMMLASHSNGVAWWWYPGGYRVNERSDFGIINPDGTDRPVTKVIREFGPRLAAERVIPKPDVWITIDRDADARGLFGVYEKVKDEFWKAVEAGKVVGLRER